MVLTCIFLVAKNILETFRVCFRPSFQLSECPEAQLDPQLDPFSCRESLMKIEVVEVLTLNQEVAAPGMQIQALYAEDGPGPRGSQEPPQHLDKPTPLILRMARQRFRGSTLRRWLGPAALARLRELCRQRCGPAHSRSRCWSLLDAGERFLGARRCRQWVESQHPGDCRPWWPLVEDATWISEERE